MTHISPTARIYPNVRLGENVRIGDWAVVGLPPAGAEPGELETVIEEGSHVRSHAVVYAGSKIGPRFQSGHRAILGPAMSIGAGCSLGTGAVAAGFGLLRDGARVHSMSYLGQFAAIHENAWVGPSEIIDSDREHVTVVGAGAIMALRVIVHAGVRIGERALIGVRCRITKDVAPYRLVVGNPPRAVRTIDQIAPPSPGGSPPYKADPPEIQEAVFARHVVRDGCTLADDDWRVAIWQRLNASRFPQTSPSAPAGAGDATALGLAPAIAAYE